MECFKRNQHPQRPARLLVRPGGMLAFHSDPKKPTQSSRTTGSKSWDFPLALLLATGRRWACAAVTTHGTVARANALGGVFVGPFVPPATVTRLGDLKILENTIRLPCYERACFWARGVHLAKSIFFVHLPLK